MNPNELRQRAAELETRAQTLVTSVATENRDFTETERSQSDGWIAEADRLERQAGEIESINQRVEARQAGRGRTSTPLATSSIEPGESEDDKRVRTGGFRSHGHFAYAVFRGCRSDAAPEDREPLNQYRSSVERISRQNRSVTGMSVSVDPDGGDLVPIDYASEIWRKAYEVDSLFGRVNFMPIAGNTFRMAGEAESSRANGSRRGGIRCYNQAEAGQMTGSKPKFDGRELRLKNYTVMVYLTDETLEDAPAMVSWLDQNVPEEIAFKGSDDLVSGTGAGMFLGLLNSPALVTVAKESGQANGTIVATNVIKMFSRAWASSRKNLIWVINQDAEPQLAQMAIATGSASGQLVYMPPNGLSESPYATLQGRPVVPIEQCPTIGTVGDIMLVDPTQIMGIRKVSGIRMDTSIHLRFDYGETAMRYKMRLDAQPAWATALTPFKGTNTQSPYIALQAR